MGGRFNEQMSKGRMGDLMNEVSGVMHHNFHDVRHTQTALPRALPPCTAEHL